MNQRRIKLLSKVIEAQKLNKLAQQLEENSVDKSEADKLADQVFDQIFDEMVETIGKLD